MKKKIAILLMIVLSISLIGCGDKKVTSDKENVGQGDEQSKEDKRTSDDLYKIVKTTLPKVEELFQELGIPYEEEKNKKNTKYDDKVSIAYEKSSKKNVGEFPLASYGAAFNDEGDIKYLIAKMILNVDDEKMKDKDFKFEETEMYKLSNILIPEKRNYDEINKKIEGYYKERTSKQVEVEYGNIKERFLLGDNVISYTIIINP